MVANYFVFIWDHVNLATFTKHLPIDNGNA